MWSSASLDLLSLFTNDTELIDYAPGDKIFEEDAPGDKMYVVIEGEVALSVRNTQISTIKAGEMFGEMALIDTNPRSATATAVTKCKLAAVDERRFTFLVQQTPFFALYVMRLMTQRLRAIDDTIS
ncbi:MAG: cyclic nucleotide-binding domain-containing protein [Pseudomonadota bacterium]|nr:cyclic nucleotide-binding domain-containing protein [Pseudomonadota bacterium]